MTSCFSSEFADLNGKKKAYYENRLKQATARFSEKLRSFLFFFSLLLVKLTHV